MKGGIFPLHQLGDQPGQIGSLRGSEESAAAGFLQAGQRDQPRGLGPLAALRSLRCMSAGAHGLGAETQASGDRPSVRTRSGCVETA